VHGFETLVKSMLRNGDVLGLVKGDALVAARALALCRRGSVSWFGLGAGAFAPGVSVGGWGDGTGEEASMLTRNGESEAIGRNRAEDAVCLKC